MTSFDRIFPDRKNDGMLQNPDTEELFDFDKVMQSDDPKEALREIAYYPEGANSSNDFYVFISGLGQVAEVSSERSRRYASRLQVGVVNLNNASFLKKDPSWDFNSKMDWVDAALDRLGLSGSPVIDNAEQLILMGATQQVPIRIAADSHGTIFLARAIRQARDSFLSERQNKKALWEKRTSQYVNIVTFGNGHHMWPKGPNYVMVYIDGDVLPQRAGMTAERGAYRQDMYFLKYEQMFAKGNFEAHNMMFTIELLRATFEKNQIKVGDMVALLNKLQDDSLGIATPSEVSWPEDMAKYSWDRGSLKEAGLKLVKKRKKEKKNKSDKRKKSRRR